MRRQIQARKWLRRRVSLREMPKPSTITAILRRHGLTLTLMDAFSRFLLRCELVLDPDGKSVRPIFASAIAEFGLPSSIRRDNGSPFASKAPGGLTPLSAWWTRLGITHERIAPGRPQENGRHEALDNEVPRTFYRRSKRSLPAHLPRIEYPAYREQRRVEKDGGARLFRSKVHVGPGLYGEVAGFGRSRASSQGQPSNG
jgi:transposase InsO family protein